MGHTRARAAPGRPEPRPHHQQAGGLALHGDPCVTCLPMTAPPNGGNCTIRGATRRRHADRTLLMLQNPHHYPWCHAPSPVQDRPTGATPPRGVTSPTPNGGNCTIRGATRRRHAEGRLLMLQNPHHYPRRHAPSLVRDCPPGADKHRRDPAARARVGRERVRRAPINTGRASPAMTRGRRAASSAAKLVTDEALHPIRKIQPQPIRCNPPDHVQSSRCDGSHRRCKHASTMTDDASTRHGQPPSAARERQRHRRRPRQCQGPRRD